jgi:hypothetical protein
MIYLGRRASREGWVSFDSDPGLRETKARLQGDCLPCLTGLLEQLRGGADRIALGPAWDCWKVIALLPGEDEALELLGSFGDAHPGERVRGKVGRGGADRRNWALIFHTRTEENRDRLLALLREVAARRSPVPQIFCSRGCGRPYQDLLGPWEEWEPTTPVRHPQRVARIMAALRESLYGSPR